jgi:hypothetical protein
MSIRECSTCHFWKIKKGVRVGLCFHPTAIHKREIGWHDPGKNPFDYCRFWIDKETKSDGMESNDSVEIIN